MKCRHSTFVMSDITKKQSSATNPIEDESNKERFAQLFSDVVPLKSSNKAIFKPITQKPSSLGSSETSKVRYITSDSVETLDAPTSYLKANCDKNLLRKLKKNAYPIGDQIDIHGCNRFEAQEELSHFFATTTANCVLVIHGRGLTVSGRPILKTVARAWLTQQEFVLAYCEAKIENGGEGAVLVLVKKISINIQI